MLWKGVAKEYEKYINAKLFQLVRLKIIVFRQKENQKILEI